VAWQESCDDSIAKPSSEMDQHMRAASVIDSTGNHSYCCRVALGIILAAMIFLSSKDRQGICSSRHRVLGSIVMWFSVHSLGIPFHHYNRKSEISGAGRHGTIGGTPTFVLTGSSLQNAQCSKDNDDRSHNDGMLDVKGN